MTGSFSAPPRRLNRARVPALALMIQGGLGCLLALSGTYSDFWTT